MGMFGTVQDATNKENEMGERKIPRTTSGCCVCIRKWPNRLQVLPGSFVILPLQVSVCSASEVEPDSHGPIPPVCEVDTGGVDENVKKFNGCFSIGHRGGWGTSGPYKNRMTWRFGHRSTRSRKWLGWCGVTRISLNEPPICRDRVGPDPLIRRPIDSNEIV